MASLVVQTLLALSTWTTSFADNWAQKLQQHHSTSESVEMKFSSLAALGALSGISSAIDPPRQPHQPLGNGSKILTYNETVTAPSFRSQSLSVDWLSGKEDGLVIYLSDDTGDLVLENFVTGNTSTFVSADKIPEDYHEYWIRSDQEKVLFATNYTKQYRHSYFADYFILDVASGELTALADDQAGDVQYAELAPVGDSIAYVRGNNLFIYNGTATTQITEDGGPDLFNAVPDWVYEEEVFGDRYALWWSPDAKYIAYLSFNETGVGTFTIPYFMDNEAVAPVYPYELELRYPKAGTTNPTVDFRLLELDTMTVDAIEYDAFARNDTIIGEVAWVTDDHSSVVYRAYNRVQDEEKLILVDTTSLEAKVVRERDGTDGWLDNQLAIQYIGAIGGSYQNYYLDLSDISGWNHLYLFPVDGGENITLTSGEWEVVSVLKVDTARQLIYYTSTEHHSTERHVYSVSYSTKNKTALVDDTVDAWWSASFSSAGGYYLLNYGGPDVPYQELYSINDTSNPIRTVTNNSALYQKLQAYNLPNITYFELEHPSGFSLNVLQRLPPNFDPTKKYPVLFAPYGGPGAQQITKSFASINHLAYWASDPDLQYITYVIDNRGTGYKGRAFRSTVTSQLGKLEAEDQIWAAEQLVERYDFIDADHVTMWGWSFGGYLTSKVLEADSGVFSLGLITAPVSDWRLYDSVYTERYMKLPSTNEGGYDLTAVRKADGFKNVKGHFAIMHGTGDDNVHYQNSAALVDLLVGSGVSPEKMDMMAFTDSDHSIRYNGATAYIYKYLTKQLWEEKNRTPGQTLVHQWSRRRREDKIAKAFEA